MVLPVGNKIITLPLNHFKSKTLHYKCDDKSVMDEFRGYRPSLASLLCISLIKVSLAATAFSFPASLVEVPFTLLLLLLLAYKCVPTSWFEPFQIWSLFLN